MAKYRKRPELHSCVIPGIGVIPEGKIVEGEKYAPYCPRLLEEVKEESKVVAPKPAPLPPPAPAPKTAPKPKPEPKAAPKADSDPTVKVETADYEKHVEASKPKEEEAQEEKKPRRRKRGKK